MNDPNPRPIGPQQGFGSAPQPSDPPLSPKASEVEREDAGHAGERALDPRRIPEPVRSATEYGETCVEHARRTMHEMVASNPTGTLAVAFAVGLVCGICAARVDYH